MPNWSSPPRRPADVLAGHAPANMPTIAILQQQAATDAQIVNEQLSQAPNSRVLIERAKGVLAKRGGLDMNRSLTQLRR